MTQKEQELVEKYLAFKAAEKDIIRKENEILDSLAELSPHKVGEVIKWTEKKRKRVGGSDWHPVYKDMPPVEKTAVCTKVTARIWSFMDLKSDLKYEYDFHPITKNGSVGQNNAYPTKDYEWTGKIDESYKDK